MNVTIIGGGNIGTLMAAEAADKGHTITVLYIKAQFMEEKNRSV